MSDVVTCGSPIFNTISLLILVHHVLADGTSVEWRIIGRTENKIPSGRVDAMMPIMAQRLCLAQAAACERQLEPEYRSALEAYDKVRVHVCKVCEQCPGHIDLSKSM